MTRPAPDVSILIPAFNEEAHIASTVRGALATLEAQGLTFEIVVVDDGSTDGTAAAIAAAIQVDTRVSLLRHERNRGLGASYASGVAASRGRYVSWLPGDDAIPPEFLATMIAARLQADVVIAYPVFDRPRPMLRTLLSASYVRLMNLLCGGRIRYFNCITLLRRDLLLEVLPRNNAGFGVFAEILVHLLRAGHSYVEVPIASRNQPMERSKAFRWRNVVSVCGRTVGLWWSLRGRAATPPGPRRL
ncbi:MAG: glycosyltransferase family 2 protein [Vicinamibacterales bacterium]|nr:glycosyltransferase family 2 protein [Vicinamibacterales bacterium]